MMLRAELKKKWNDNCQCYALGKLLKCIEVREDEV